MRHPREHIADDGTRTYRVRYRRGGKETSTTFRRKSDAKTFATLLDSGDTPNEGVVIALAWLAEREKNADTPALSEFFETYVEQLTGVTPRTRANYRAMYRTHLSALGTLPLPLITRAHVAALVNDLDAGGKAPKTIKNIVHMLSSVMWLAIDEGHITKNPCKRVRLPKQSLGVTEPRFLLYEEFAALLAEIPDFYKPLVTFLAGTGMRWSEATAIQGRHLNIAAGTARVEQAWKWQGRGGGWVIGPPKTERARRTVNAAAMALAAAASQGAPSKRLVFLTERQGKPVRHNNFYNRIWLPARERAGLDDLRIHDLRHTHASWLISEGQSLEAVQDQLGHESILTTRKIYGHLLPALGVELGKAASAVLERALASGNGRQAHALGSGMVQPAGGTDE